MILRMKAIEKNNNAIAHERMTMMYPLDCKASLERSTIRAMLTLQAMNTPKKVMMNKMGARGERRHPATRNGAPIRPQNL